MTEGHRSAPGEAAYPRQSSARDEAARWAAERGLVLWNHGATADAVQRLPGVLSVASSASRYAASVLEALADGLPGARVLLAVAPGSFGKSIAEGAREAAERLGMRIQGTVAHAEVPEAPDTDVLIAAGSYRDDVELVARLRARLPAVAAVAAAMGLFGAELGARAEGVLAPSQWEEGTRFRPNLGPSPLDVVRSLRARIIAALYNPGTPANVVALQKLQAQAGSVGFAVVPAPLKLPDELDTRRPRPTLRASWRWGASNWRGRSRRRRSWRRPGGSGARRSSDGSD